MYFYPNKQKIYTKMKHYQSYKWANFFTFFYFFLLFIQQNQAQQTGRIQGRIFEDNNNNCQFDGIENGLGYLLIVAQNTQNQQFYALSDSFGNYIFDIQPDSYNLSVNLAYDGLYWSACTSTQPTIVVVAAQIDTVFLGFQPATAASLIRFELSASRLEPCKKGLITLAAQNIGTDTAFSYTTKLILDKQLTNFATISSPSFVTFSQLANDTILLNFQYTTGHSYKLQNLQQFVFSVDVSCNASSRTLFYNKLLLINDDTLTIRPIWNDAILTVKNECNTDTVNFQIENKGATNQNPIEYFVIEDNIMLRQGTINLQPNQSINILQTTLPNRSYRLEVKNPMGLPAVLGDSVVYAMNEKCDTLNGLNAVLSWYPTNDVSPFYDYESTKSAENINNFYIATSPLGYDSAHYVNQGQWLEYNIHFRNTQGATVSEIDFLDTLSSFLDISSLQMGASSHPYQFTLNQNNILNAHIHNANLIDSAANYVNSLGFLSFRVKLKNNLPNGTVIRNRAHILYDNNFAYYPTEEIFHTVGQNFIRILSDTRLDLPKKTIQIFPNPFIDQVNFLVQDEPSNLELSIFNPLGQLVQSIKQNQTNSLIFNRQNLPAGIYYYQLLSNRQLIGSGKMIAE
jgi:Secretion system C-terminal sorting domain